MCYLPTQWQPCGPTAKPNARPRVKGCRLDASQCQQDRCHESSRVRASFSTSRSEPGIMGEGLGGGCQFWTVFAAALRGTDDFQALTFGLFSGKIPGVHSGSVLVGFRGHFRRFMRAFGGAPEGIWGLFWACLELIVGRRTSLPRPVHCRAFLPARGSQVGVQGCRAAAMPGCIPWWLQTWDSRCSPTTSLSSRLSCSLLAERKL